MYLSPPCMQHNIGVVLGLYWVILGYIGLVLGYHVRVIFCVTHGRCRCFNIASQTQLEHQDALASTNTSSMIPHVLDIMCQRTQSIPT